MALVLHGAAQHSAVFDEVVYAPAGYAQWRTGEVRFNREHPPLMKLLAGGTWLGTGLPVVRAPGWEERDQWAFGRALLFGSGERASVLLFRARLPVALLSGLLVLGVWLAGSRLAGPLAGLAAALLYALDPLAIAHAGLATTDLPAAALLFAGAMALPAAIEEGGRLRIGLGGAALGAALATKFSAVLLLPLLPVLVWLSRAQLRSALARLGAVLGIAAVGVAAAYGRTGPGAWLEGFRMLSLHGAVGHPAYAFGHWSDLGWWWYFPAAWAVKTPLVVLAAQGAGIAWALRARARWSAAWTLLALPLLLAAAAVTGSLNLGVRHLLPAVPCLAVLGGGAAASLWARGGAGRAAVLGAGALLLAGTLRVHPDEMADANLLAGGPRGLWRVLSDSNVDWGQALPALAREVERRPLRRLYLAYFGTADPHAQGLRYTWAPAMNMIERREEDGPDPGGREWLAVSVTALMDVYTQQHEAYAWLRDRRMAAFPGHAIALYDVTGDAVALASLGRTARRLGEPGAAVPPLARAVELGPQDVRLRLELAAALAEAGRGRETAAVCEALRGLAGAGPREVETCAQILRAATAVAPPAPAPAPPSGGGFLIR